MATVSTGIAELCQQAKEASRELAVTSTVRKNAALHAVAAALERRIPEILEANALDLDAARVNGLKSALLDRLALDADRVEAMAVGVREVAALPDPVGEVVDGWRLPNGLDIARRRSPLGVIAIVYEARPNVTIDAGALCLKSGNAAVLRGSTMAEHSNAVLGAVFAEAVQAEGLPPGTICPLAGRDRDDLRELATQEGVVDLILPRGGEGLKQVLKQHATVPVIYAASGNCHVYVDAEADEAKARAVTLNAKTQRPGVCNAAETLLVHATLAETMLPVLLADLHEAGVEISGDDRARAAGRPTPVAAATDEDWSAEFHALKIVVGVVDSAQEAIDHVNRYGTGHSEAIVTESGPTARAFTDAVDAACVYVNASTRFTDGFEFGMGAEIGNSTQKLHARGPIGLRELTSVRYVVHGDGQVRE
ncbi:MAG: glutamate-5-semialdehyde dehydrogenase [Solirubrobacterales bacterium]